MLLYDLLDTVLQLLDRVIYLFTFIYIKCLALQAGSSIGFLESEDRLNRGIWLEVYSFGCFLIIRIKYNKLV